MGSLKDEEGQFEARHLLGDTGQRALQAVDI